MEHGEMEDRPGDEILRERMTKSFVEHCIAEFGWTDLSNDVIMDVGCGQRGNCGKAILEKFPDLGKIIFIDNNPREIRNFELRLVENMQLLIADIEKRGTLGNFLGKMDKVISTYVFHILEHKEEAFRNVYLLLKPGGEAGVVAIKESLLAGFLEELIQKPKWGRAYTIRLPENMLRSELGADYYREIVEKIGFRVLECKEERTVVSYPSDDKCKDELYNMCRNNFVISPDAVDEFKEDAFQALLKVSAKDDEGKPCHRPLQVSILLAKPREGSDSKAK